MKNRIRTMPNPAQTELKRIIYLHGKSLHSVSNAIGYDPSYLTRICKGERAIVHQEFVNKILDHLEVYGYERSRILWMCGWIDRETLPSTLSEEVFTMLSALSTTPNGHTSHRQKNSKEEVQQL